MSIVQEECRCAASATELLSASEVVGAAEVLATVPDAPEFGELGILVFGWTMVALYICWHFAGIRKGCSQMGRLGASSVGRLLFWIAGSRRRDLHDGRASEEEHLEEAIDRALEARLEKNMMQALRFVTAMHAFFQWGMSFQVLSKNPRWNSFAQSCTFLSGFAILLFSMPWHNRIAKGRPGMIFAFLNAELCLSLYNSRRSPIAMLITESGFLLTRAAYSAIYPKAVPVLWWNLLYSIIGAYAALETFNRTEFACMVILYQTQNTIAILLLCAYAARVAEANIRRDVEASVLRGESAGLCSLLDMVCDVVISLDRDLKIVDTARRFAAMVTLQGASVEGSRLQDFMPAAEDRQVFEKHAHAHAEGSVDGSGAPRAMQVKLRDSLGNLIRVELFCVAFQSPVRRSFFVGIKEMSESLPIPECRPFHARSRRRARTPHRARGTAATPPRAGTGGFQRDTSASSSGSESSARSASTGSGSLRGEAAARGRRSRSRPHGTEAAAPLAIEGASSDLSNLEPTSDVGIEMALVRLMRLCVLSTDGAGTDATMTSTGSSAGDCCPFHRRVRRLRERLHKFRGMACAPQFNASFLAQCLKCGLLVGGAPADSGQLHCFACETAVDHQRAIVERPIETL